MKFPKVYYKSVYKYFEFNIFYVIIPISGFFNKVINFFISGVLIIVNTLTNQ